MNSSLMPTPRLSSPVTLKNCALWFGEIELHEGKIVISGWTWTGPVEKEIPLSDTTTFEKWTVQEGPNFRLHFSEGNSVFGRIEKGAGLWGLELEDDEGIKVRQRH
jgi:hypothetical protein